MTTQDIIDGWENGVEPYRLSKWWKTQSCQDAFERAKQKRSERLSNEARSYRAPAGTRRANLETGRGRAMIANLKSYQIEQALELLATARNLLRKAGARKSRAYVARAIKSTQGARRNAWRFEFKAATLNESKTQETN